MDIIYSPITKPNYSHWRFLLSALIMMSLSLNGSAQYVLIDANNTGQVYQQTAPAGMGEVADIRAKLFEAGLPTSVVNSRLTQGEFATNIAETEAMQETAAALANRPATYTGEGTEITAANLESLRDAIATDGGIFIFRGTIDLDAGAKLIQLGPNTTIWIDGTINYTGPVLPGTTPDEFSVSDVPSGVFEINGTNGNNINNVKIFGTKRSEVNGNKRVAGVYVRRANDLVIEGVNFITCRNVLFLHNVYGNNSRLVGNYIYDCARRAIHLKASNNTLVKHNLMVKCAVDGVDMDAYSNGTKCIKNVAFDAGSRYQYWTEIAVKNCMIDSNIGIHIRNGDGGFQENGSENARPDEPPTQNNSWINNHVFYADDSNSYRQGFSFHPNRKIDRPSTTFQNNMVWYTNANAYKNNPKTDDLMILDDVYYHLFDAANANVNTVSITNPPSVLAPGESLNITVDYNSIGENEIVAIVSTPDGTLLKEVSQVVSDGSDTISLTIDQQPTVWPLDFNYKLEILIRPVGGTYNDQLDAKTFFFHLAEGDSNSVTITSAPLSVAPREDVKVTVDYLSSGDNEVVAIVNSPTGTWLKNAKKTVPSGAGSVSLSIFQSTDWPVADNYKLEVLIRPVGTSYNDLLAVQDTTFNVVGMTTDGSGNSNDSSTVIIVDYPTSIESGADVKVTIDYVSATQNEVVAIVNSPTGTWLKNAKQTVEAGSGTVELSVTQPTNWPVGENYKLEVLIRPVGSAYNDQLDLVTTTFNVVETIVSTYNFEKENIGLLYPNPINYGQQLTLDLTNISYKVSSVDVYNVQGTRIATRKIEGDKMYFNTKIFPSSGLYIFEINYAELGKSALLKLIVQ